MVLVVKNGQPWVNIGKGEWRLARLSECATYIDSVHRDMAQTNEALDVLREQSVRHQETAKKLEAKVDELSRRLEVG